MLVREQRLGIKYTHLHWCAAFAAAHAPRRWTASKICTVQGVTLATVQIPCIT